MAKPEQNPKIKGEKLAEFHGLTVYGRLKKAKLHGKDRIWIQIRQGEPKKYRVAESLSYMRSLDVQFEEVE
jgi:hypothetical protein